MHRLAAVTLPFAGLSSYGAGVLYVIGAGRRAGHPGTRLQRRLRRGHGQPHVRRPARHGRRRRAARVRRSDSDASPSARCRAANRRSSRSPPRRKRVCPSRCSPVPGDDVALVLAVYFSLSAPGVRGLDRARPGAADAGPGGGPASCRWPGCWSWCSAGRARASTSRRLGLALAAVAACCQATYLVASRNGFTRVPSTQAVTVILVGAAIAIWAVALPVDGAGQLLAWVTNPAAWLAILFAGAVGAGLAKVWLLRGVRRVGGTLSSVLMLVEPITGVALACRDPGPALRRARAARRRGRSSWAPCSPSGPRPWGPGRGLTPPDRAMSQGGRGGSRQFGHECRLRRTVASCSPVLGRVVAGAVRERDAPGPPRSARRAGVRGRRRAHEVSGDLGLVPQPARHPRSACPGRTCPWTS